MPLPLAMRLPGSIRSVRATRRERTCALPGDSLITHPIQLLTYAITIACPPHEVWPWLAQMGSGGRAGWYSYDRIDNAGRHSADCILCRLQDVAVGATFPPLPGIDNGLTVVQFEREPAWCWCGDRTGTARQPSPGPLFWKLDAGHRRV